MILLDATTKSLEILLGGAVTTNQLPYVASYVDVDQTAFAMSGASAGDGLSNNTTAVTIVAAPGATTTRQLKYLSVRNKDTVQAQVTVQYNDNGTKREMLQVALDPNDTLTYLDGRGFEVLNSLGAIKSTPQTTDMSRDKFSGDGTTLAFTLTKTPPSQNSVLVTVDGVMQRPGTDYTISGTTLTFVTAPVTGTNNVVVIYVGVSLNTGVPSDGTVTAAKIVDGTITPPKLANSTTPGTAQIPTYGAGGVNFVWTDYARLPLNINPNWLLDQINEGTSYAGTSGVVQGPDGWSSNNNNASAGRVAMQRVTDPDNSALLALKISCTTSQASMAAADHFAIYSAIEGYDTADLKIGTASASSITVMFKAKLPAAGTYGVSIRNSGATRSYVTTITVPDANENAYAIVVPMDTAGTWLYTNGVGLYVSICLAAGSNFQTIAGSWQAGNFVTTSAQANFMSANTNVAYLKRLHVIPGGVALAYSSQDIQRELAKAQRYYFKSFPQGTAPASSAGAGGAFNFIQGFGASAGNESTGSMRYPVVMRTSPTVTGYNPSAAGAQIRNLTAGADCTNTAVQNASDASVEFTYTTAGGSAAGYQNILHIIANARLS